MSSNFSPIYSRVADIQWSGEYLTTALGNDADLSAAVVDTDAWLLFTADATNGGYVQKVRLRATPAGNTTATVFRLWVNNGSTIATAANSALFDEITLPATTASATAATASYEIPCNFALPPGYKLYGTLGTTSANGWQATVFGGKY